ncbi:hypothetical protein GCM10010253_19510 [Streptomyces badius]|uniref:Uncharacterized protein n=1 Tax=Streptomyces badius TaxID=1941 RepID=A0ABQ2T1R7_STRBA|nr:hypothetical protein GCM10010253_19510 [Streptomyces badius]
MRLSGGEGRRRRSGRGHGHDNGGGAKRPSLIGHLKQSSPGVPRGGQGGMERAARVNASQVTTFDRSYERKDRP